VAYKPIRDEAGMRKLDALVSKADICAIDTEASNKDPRSASLLGVAFSVNAGEAFYVPVTEYDLVGVSTEMVKDCLQKLLAGRTRFVGHNIKFDCVLLRRHEIRLVRMPTQHCGYIIGSSRNLKTENYHNSSPARQWSGSGHWSIKNVMVCNSTSRP
jgi:DNA polymerase I-like protein with 3'-5' exonuclease and polymerase domains